MASVVPYVVAGLGGALVTLAIVVGASYALWRLVRRRWRILAARAAATGLAGISDRVRTSGWVSSLRAGGPVDRSFVPAVVASRGMWRSVRDAESAVASADEAGAPVGDLPSLCRRLRAAASDIDRMLRARPEGTPVATPEPVGRHLADVAAAARNVHDVALRAMAEAFAGTGSSLVADADREAHALAAGLDRARPLVAGVRPS
jgi:hypothetical protein